MLRFTTIVWISLGCLFWVSCKKKVNVQLPYDEEKVINILSDIHFAKSASKIHGIETKDSMRNIYENQVFEINGITRKEYDTLIEVLESDLNMYYDIEKKVHQHLKTIQNDKS